MDKKEEKRREKGKERRGERKGEEWKGMLYHRHSRSQHSVYVNMLEEDRYCFIFKTFLRPSRLLSLWVWVYQIRNPPQKYRPNFVFLVLFIILIVTNIGRFVTLLLPLLSTFGVAHWGSNSLTTLIELKFEIKMFKKINLFSQIKNISPFPILLGRATL